MKGKGGRKLEGQEEGGRERRKDNEKNYQSETRDMVNMKEIE